MAKPALPEAVLRAALQREFAIDAEALEPLSHGVDTEAAGLRVRAADGGEWFAKLRRGRFAEIALALPAFLAEAGICEVVAPLAARDGRRCASMGELELAVYPFVAGSNGLDVELSEAHWLGLGRALRRIHDVALPGALAIVDWDEPILAPRERDVMFVGGGYYAKRCSPEEERSRFLRGYGDVPLDPQAVATFRCERVVEDLVLDWEEGTPGSSGRIANILSPGSSLERALA